MCETFHPDNSPVFEREPVPILLGCGMESVRHATPTELDDLYPGVPIDGLALPGTSDTVPDAAEAATPEPEPAPAPPAMATRPGILNRMIAPFKRACLDPFTTATGSRPDAPTQEGETERNNTHTK